MKVRISFSNKMGVLIRNPQKLLNFWVAWVRGIVGGVSQIVAWVHGVAWIHKILAWVSVGPKFGVGWPRSKIWRVSYFLCE